MPRPLLPDQEARARAFLAGQIAPGPLRDAATVVLLRDGVAGLEVYLLRRHARMSFAAGMHAFPGGAVDPRDGDDDTPWAGPPPAAWTQRLAADERLVRALACAAVRETFEESGVLLAGAAADAGAAVGEVTAADWERDRRALLDGSLALSELLVRRGLVLRADLLRPWTHWITPEFEPRRYDTRFLVAALPPGQRTRDVGGEADRVAWVRPAAAAAAQAAGELPMLPPTAVTLGELAGFDRVAEVLAAADAREIAPILPRVAADGSGVRMLLPDEPGYPA